MYRFLIFILGIILMSIGLFFILLYLNLFVLGYSFFEFVKFIIMRVDCSIFFIGIILVVISIEGKKLYGLFLRYLNKHERRERI